MKNLALVLLVKVNLFSSMLYAQNINLCLNLFKNETEKVLKTNSKDLEDLVIENPTQFLNSFHQYDIEKSSFRKALISVATKHPKLVLDHFDKILTLPNNLQVLVYKQYIERLPDDFEFVKKVIDIFFTIDFGKERLKVFSRLAESVSTFRWNLRLDKPDGRDSYRYYYNDNNNEFVYFYKYRNKLEDEELVVFRNTIASKDNIAFMDKGAFFNQLDTEIIDRILKSKDFKILNQLIMNKSLNVVFFAKIDLFSQSSNQKQLLDFLKKIITYDMNTFIVSSDDTVDGLGITSISKSNIYHILEKIKFQKPTYYYELLDFFVKNLFDFSLNNLNLNTPGLHGEVRRGTYVYDITFENIEKLLDFPFLNDNVRKKYIRSQLYLLMNFTAAHFIQKTVADTDRKDRAVKYLDQFYSSKNFEKILRYFYENNDTARLEAIIDLMFPNNFSQHFYGYRRLNSALLGLKRLKLLSKLFDKIGIPKKIIKNKISNVANFVKGLEHQYNIKFIAANEGNLFDIVDFAPEEREVVFQQFLNLDPRSESDKEKLQAKYYFGFTDSQMFRLDPIEFLENNKAALDEARDSDQLRELLKSYGLSKTQLDILFGRVKKRELALWMLPYVVKSTYSDANTSMELIKKITGMKYEVSQLESYSNDTLGTFYETVVELYNFGAREEMFSKFSKEMFDKKHIAKLIEVMTNIKSLSQLNFGDGVASIEETLVLLEVDKINLTTYQEIQNRYKSFVVKRIQDVFAENKFAFSYDQIEKLTKEWGDLNAIWVLVARLKQLNPTEVPVIAKILQASLNNEFNAYKFKGLTDSDKKQIDQQLTMLNDAQRDRWSKSEVIVRKAEGKDDQSQVAQANLESLINVLRTNLKPHWQSLLGDSGIKSKLLGNKGPRYDAIKLKWFDQARSYKGDPKLFFKQNNILNIDSELKILTMLVEALIDNPSDFTTNKSLVRIIRWSLEGLKQESLERHKLQLLEDIKEITTRLEFNSKSEVGLKLIATVKSSDPNLLLTIGDCVNAASCQNYKTGSVIRTLPGYVIDASVQAILSYELSALDFNTVKEFNQVSEWLGKSDVIIDFDGNKKVFKFKKSGVAEITTKVLGKAFLRNILKVGLEEKLQKTGLVLERDYSQTHENLGQMRSQHNEIVQMLAKDLNAVTTGSIKIFRSRNPEGHYSDQGGGVKTTDYVISVP